MQWCWVAAFFFVFVVSNVSCGNEPRVIGGSASPNGTFKFLPRIQFLYPMMPTKFPWRQFPYAECSSTIISKRHILTAAHCVVEGSYPIKDNENLRKIGRHVLVMVDVPPKEEFSWRFDMKKYAIATRIYFHPSYNKKLELCDIAIIEFPEGTEIETEPVTLINNYQPKYGDHGVAVGYGKILGKKGDVISPDELQNATVSIFPPQSCSIPGLGYHICTGTKTLMAYSGDSGGPLLINQNETFYQVGIASFVINVYKEWHAFYSPLIHYCPCIEKVTKNQVKCQPLPESTPPKSQHPITQSSTTSQDYQSSSQNPTPQALHGKEYNSCNFIGFNVFALIFITLFSFL